ncbi:hypothetical protein RL1085 [Rhizobium johnstonii 3841]|uniref:Uncharacterized protein n=1 Tax=Rhizobium johnstonii (strain DSM 114642 / LMG 32736 / 3841) TaxID=216596 RepID=Q1MKC4_RHIJ3|nr:hypothetical protein RL1085 [Rhizobium johnstonii 3841]
MAEMKKGTKKALRDCNNVPQSLVSVRPGKPDGGSLNPGTIQLLQNRTALTFVLRNSWENGSPLPWICSNGFRFLPSPGKPHANSTMRNLWSLAFQQSN